MKITKSILTEAILNIADSLGIKSNYEVLINSYPSFPKIIEMITYQMFLKEFDFKNCSDKLYESYRVIYDYAQELDKKGFVKFG